MNLKKLSILAQKPNKSSILRLSFARVILKPNVIGLLKSKDLPVILLVEEFRTQIAKIVLLLWSKDPDILPINAAFQSFIGPMAMFGTFLTLFKLSIALCMIKDLQVWEKDTIQSQMRLLKFQKIVTSKQNI